MAERKPVIKQIRNNARSLANKAVDAAREGVDRINDYAERTKLAYDKKRLRPVFLEDVENWDNVPTSMVRIIDSDKQHEENPACEGSIGFFTSSKDMDILNVYTKNADSLGVNYYPVKQEDIYYVDPTDPGFFISLDEYFDYSRKARVDELLKIAHSLGAKKVTINLIQNAKSFVSIKGKAEVGVAKAGTAKANASQATKKEGKLEYKKTATFKGGQPKAPKLRYFANEPEIEYLISMRMDKHNHLDHLNSYINYINSSGIKEDVAVKIDAAIAKMKIKGNASVASEVQEEARMVFEYIIDF